MGSYDSDGGGSRGACKTIALILTSCLCLMAIIFMACHEPIADVILQDIYKVKNNIPAAALKLQEKNIRIAVDAIAMANGETKVTGATTAEWKTNAIAAWGQDKFNQFEKQSKDAVTTASKQFIAKIEPDVTKVRSYVAWANIAWGLDIFLFCVWGYLVLCCCTNCCCVSLWTAVAFISAIFYFAIGHFLLVGIQNWPFGGKEVTTEVNKVANQWLQDQNVRNTVGVALCTITGCSYDTDFNFLTSHIVTEMFNLLNNGLWWVGLFLVFAGVLQVLISIAMCAICCGGGGGKRGGGGYYDFSGSFSGSGSSDDDLDIDFEMQSYDNDSYEE